MIDTAIADRVRAAKDATDQRLMRFPSHPLFLFSLRELEIIEKRILSTNKIDNDFYQSLNIGVMCAKELETSDPEFSDLVYAMLEEIRKEANPA